MAAGIGGSYSRQTGSYEKSGTTSGGTTGTGKVDRNLLPEQAATAPDIFSVLHGYMTNPRAAVEPSRMAARDQVNQNYSGLADRVRQQFLTSGGGRSGKAGQAQLEGELGRSGALANADNSAAVQAAQLPLTATALAEQFLGINLGQTSSGSTTNNQISSENGSNEGTAWGVSGGVGTK